MYLAIAISFIIGMVCGWAICVIHANKQIDKFCREIEKLTDGKVQFVKGLKYEANAEEN